MGNRFIIKTTRLLNPRPISLPSPNDDRVRLLTRCHGKVHGQPASCRELGSRHWTSGRPLIGVVLVFVGGDRTSLSPQPPLQRPSESSPRHGCPGPYSLQPSSLSVTRLIGHGPSAAHPTPPPVLLPPLFASPIPTPRPAVLLRSHALRTVPWHATCPISPAIPTPGSPRLQNDRRPHRPTAGSRPRSRHARPCTRHRPTTDTQRAHHRRAPAKLPGGTTTTTRAPVPLPQASGTTPYQAAVREYHGEQQQQQRSGQQTESETELLTYSLLAEWIGGNRKGSVDDLSIPHTSPIIRPANFMFTFPAIVPRLMVIHLRVRTLVHLVNRRRHPAAAIYEA